MQAEQKVLAQLGPGATLTPWQCQRLLELELHYGEEQFDQAVKKLRGIRSDDPVMLLSHLLKDSAEKTCRQCGFKWNTARVGTSLCPRCYLGAVDPSGNINQAIIDQYLASAQ